MEIGFTELFNKLKAEYSEQVDTIQVQNSQVEIRNHRFTSSSSLVPPSNGVEEQTRYHQSIAIADSSIAENKTFTYPIFYPQPGKTYDRVILMFHGLNERNWRKYLPWAYYMAVGTNCPVILFPMSFHVNRSPSTWVNPRAMQGLLEERQQMEGQDNSTFANVALSQRISDDPLRFFSAGLQSGEDIVCLLEDIKHGKIHGLMPNTRVNFFSYSIGVMLAQVLFLANPKGLLTNSKMFIFCGGAHFSSMKGSSRLIMDKVAYTKLHSFFLLDFFADIKRQSPFANFFRENKLGEGFITMLSPECNADAFDSRMDELAEQVRVITLRKDEVIPSKSIQATFAKLMGRVKGIVQELDFGYSYCHEVPFPIFANDASKQVDACFLQVFRPVVDFLK